MKRKKRTGAERKKERKNKRINEKIKKIIDADIFEAAGILKLQNLFVSINFSFSSSLKGILKIL
jgi:hypothetical protein